MIIEAPKASIVSTCFIVYLIAVIMYRLFLYHYSLLVDEKMNFITPCFWKLSDGLAKHVQQG